MTYNLYKHTKMNGKFLNDSGDDETFDGRTQAPIKKQKTAFMQESPLVAGSFFLPKISKTGHIEKEVIIDIGECKKLWDEFSPQKNLFETWEFRQAFHEAYKCEPHFILLKNQKKNMALLPLAMDDKKQYEWFGTNWQEEACVFSKQKNLVPRILECAPSPLKLDAISSSGAKYMPKNLLAQDDPKYVLDVSKFQNHENYLMTLKKNNRRNLRKDRNRIEKMSPKIEINKFSDLKNMINLSVNRFTKKGEDTDWEDKRRVQAIKKIIALSGKSYAARMISIRIGKKVAGVDLICLQNKTYFAIKCGYDVYGFPGIGNYMNLYEIDDAIKLGMKKVDFLQSSYSWKNKFFQAVPLFKIEKT